jgi:transcription termination factor Rho
MYDILELSNKLLPELRDIARELKIKKTESLKKQDLIYRILDQQAIEATEKRKKTAAENMTSDPLNQLTRTGMQVREEAKGQEPLSRLLTVPLNQLFLSHPTT